MVGGPILYELPKRRPPHFSQKKRKGVAAKSKPQGEV
jgi:hypothetical protein